MKGVYCDGAGVRLRDDLPEPQAGPGEVVVRVRAVGICDTDLQLARGYMGFRGVLGHEFRGRGRGWPPRDGRDQCRVSSLPDLPRRSTGTLPAQDGHRHPEPRRGRDGRAGPRPDRQPSRGPRHHRRPRGRLHRASLAAAASGSSEQVAARARGPDGDRRRRQASGCLCALGQARPLEAPSSASVGKHPEELALAGEGIATYPLTRAVHAASAAKSFDVVVDCTGSPSGLPTALGPGPIPAGRSSLKTTVAGTYNVDLVTGFVIDEDPTGRLRVAGPSPLPSTPWPDAPSMYDR